MGPFGSLHFWLENGLGLGMAIAWAWKSWSANPSKRVARRRILPFITIAGLLLPTSTHITKSNVPTILARSVSTMASLPFPFFLNQAPVDVSNQRAALSAVGKCRLDPATCLGANNDADEYRAICNKNREQAMVDTETPETKNENKKLKKKYMKQGVAMASTYLEETLSLDVSVVHVEVVVEAADIVNTDGCLAACLLDAGCAAIVVDGLNLEALDAAMIPRERLVAHFADEGTVHAESVAAALKFAGTISVTLSKNSLEVVDSILSLVTDKKDKVSFLLTASEAEDLTDVVAAISKKCKDGKGDMGLVDPTAAVLGLCFAACMKTDRDDGLFTTVVCTRSEEALGLVYSSKVSCAIRFSHACGSIYSFSRQ